MRDFDIDFSALARQILAKGDFRKHPESEIRLGTVIGYDPNWQKSTNSHSFPYVSIQLSGDTAPLHKIRFAEWYVPNIGDTVWVACSGPDVWVMGALAGANKQILGQLRSPVSIMTSNHFTDTEVFNTVNTGSTYHTFSNITAQTPFLPNRIYRAEASVTFQVSHTQGTNLNGITFGLSGGSTKTGSTGTGTTTIPSISTIYMSGVYNTSFNISGGSNGVFTSLKNLNGNLYNIQQMIIAAGPCYISAPGLPNGTQAVGCNWSTSGTNYTGLYPSGAKAAQAAISSSTWYYNPTGSPTANNYEIYLSQPFNNNFSTSGVNNTASQMLQINNTLTIPSLSIPSLGLNEPTVTTSGSGTNTSYSEVSLGIIAPSVLGGGGGTYQEIAKTDATGSFDGKYFTLTGSKTFWVIPDALQTPRTWNGGAGPEYQWKLAMQLLGSGTNSGNFTVTNVSQQLFIYDCGVAS